MSRRGWSTANFLRLPSALLTAVPITMAAWGKTSVTGVSQNIVGLFVSSGNGGNEFRLSIGAANGIGATSTVGSTGSTAVSSTTISANVLFAACAVFAGATDRRAFLNGGGKGTNATSSTPATTFNRTSIGVDDDSSPGAPFASGGTGDIGEVAIWRAALSDADVARHATGIDARCIQREFLVGYWKLDGGGLTEINLVNRNADMTLVGALSLSPPPPRIFTPRPIPLFMPGIGP